MIKCHVRRELYNDSILFILIIFLTDNQSSFTSSCVFGVLSGERAPSSVITPEPGVLPLSGERGPSFAFSLDPEPSPKKMQLAQDSSKSGALITPQNLQSLRLVGCWTSLGVESLRWYLERECGFCGSGHCCGI